LSNKKNILFGFMVFNATFNNISVILWRSVLLVEEPEFRRKPPAISYWQTLWHNVASNTPLLCGFCHRFIFQLKWFWFCLISFIVQKHSNIFCTGRANWQITIKLSLLNYEDDNNKVVSLWPFVGLFLFYSLNVMNV
jgi:hypothetical protein